MAPTLLVGESLVGEGDEVAHVDLMIGSKSGPVGEAFAHALVNQKEGHTNLLAVVAPNLPSKPDTIISNKVTIKVVGSSCQVPENQDMIRILQYLGCLDEITFFSGHYCWNATCNNCIFTYADPKTGDPVTIKACQTRVFEGMKVLHLPKDVQKK